MPEMGQALEVLYALWRLDEISGMQGAQILQNDRYARLSIARCGYVNLTADQMKRSFTLTCIAGKRCVISCAIYIAVCNSPAFLFLRR
ncbi:protein [Escherichia coli]|uniref:Protein n=1 Tax=Escherichia coli TaxID=562 RepID=A0A376KQX9_ECOLX|nr:protein [Escherichia coli]